MRLTGRVAAMLWPYLNSHRPLIAGSIFVSLCDLLLRLAQPWPLKWAFDALTLGDEALLPLTDGRVTFFGTPEAYKEGFGGSWESDNFSSTSKEK